MCLDQRAVYSCFIYRLAAVTWTPFFLATNPNNNQHSLSNAVTRIWWQRVTNIQQVQVPLWLAHNRKQDPYRSGDNWSRSQYLCESSMKTDFYIKNQSPKFQNDLNLSIWWWGENVSLQLDLEAVTQFSNLWVLCTVIFMHLILHILTSVCIFSILLFIHFLICWQGKQDLVRRN